MSVREFREFLLQLACTYEAATRHDLAAGLRKLSELFDRNQNQKVGTFLDEIRRARGIETVASSRR